MFENKTKNAMMAMAVVAMFMLSAFAVVLAPSDAALGNSETDLDGFTVNMRTTDTFSYSPGSNFEGVNFTWTVKQAGNVVSNTSSLVNSTEGSFTATTGVEGTANLTIVKPVAGTFSVEVKASITTGGILQEKTQTITFIVKERIGITVDSQATTVSGSDGTYTVGLNTGLASAKVYKFAIVGNTDASFSSPSATSGIDAALGTGADAGKIVVTVPANVTQGTYTVTSTASYNSGTGSDLVTQSTDSKAFSFQITVSPGLILGDITNPNTVVGNEDQDTFAISTDGQGKGITINSVEFADANGASAPTGSDFSASSTYVNGVSIAKNGDYAATITFPTENMTNDQIASNKAYATVNMKVKATATASDNSTVYAYKEYSVKVYRELKFTTTPTISAGFTGVIASSNNGLDVLLTTSVDGATKISYNWGDGTEYSKNIYDVNASFQSVNHTYARAGTYFIQITASNDFGDTTYIQPYTTGDFINLGSVKEKKLDISSISNETVDGKLKLSAVVNVADGQPAPAYKWFLTEKGGEKTELTTSSEKVVSIDNTGVKKFIILDPSKLKDDSKITFQAAVTFEGDTAETVKESSYVYNDTKFLSQNGWILWALPIVALALVVIAAFVTGFVPVVIVPAAITAIVWIALMVCRFMGVL